MFQFFFKCTLHNNVKSCTCVAVYKKFISIERLSGTFDWCHIVSIYTRNYKSLSRFLAQNVHLDHRHLDNCIDIWSLRFLAKQIAIIWGTRTPMTIHPNTNRLDPTHSLTAFRQPLVYI